jgi:integrase
MPRKTKTTTTGLGSIVFRESHQRYYLRYYVGEAGQRRQVWRSLDTANREEAERAAAKIRALLSAKSDRQRLDTIAGHLSAAERREAEAARAVLPRLPLGKVWEVFLAGPFPRNFDPGPATLRQYGFQWQGFVGWMQEQQARVTTFDGLETDHAAGYLRHLSGPRRLTVGTANKHLVLCRTVCKVVLEANTASAKYLMPPANPFAGQHSRKAVQEHRRGLSVEALAKVCDTAEGELKLLLFLGLYTGLRLKDCCLLEWPAVDLARGRIAATPSKTRRRADEPLPIPIAAHLRPMLEAVPPAERHGFVLPELGELYSRGRVDTVTDRVQALFVRCGVPIYRPGTGPGTGKRAVLQYGFHSLRHSFVTLLRDAGVPQAAVQALTGHKTRAMLETYTHIGTEATARAIAALPSVATPALPAPATAGNGTVTRDEALARIRARLAADDVPEVLRADLLAQLAHL